MQLPIVHSIAQSWCLYSINIVPAYAHAIEREYLTNALCVIAPAPQPVSVLRREDIQHTVNEGDF